MRKILTTLLLPVLAFTSCHSDDSIIVPKATAKLILEANATETFTYKPVLFTVKDDKGNLVPVEATVYNVTDNKAVKDRRFKAESAKEYQFQAKTAIPGRIYDSSELFTVKVTDPSKKELSIDGKASAVSQATLLVKRVKDKDAEGKEILRDKLVLVNDVYHNEYQLIAGSGNPSTTSIDVTFLVPNNTVKHSKGVISDFGKRVYPNDLDKNALKEIIVVQGAKKDKETIAKYELSSAIQFYNLPLPEKVTETQVIKKGYVEFKHKNLVIDYFGDLSLVEIVE